VLQVDLDVTSEFKKTTKTIQSYCEIEFMKFGLLYIFYKLSIFILLLFCCWIMYAQYIIYLFQEVPIDG
jgi:hypothetical protein